MAKGGDGMRKLSGLEALADLHQSMGGERAPEPVPGPEEGPVARPVMLYVSRDRKARKGKEVTLVEGFDADLHDGLGDELSRSLKAHCGVGGGWKEGVILLQGDHRARVSDWLVRNGFKVKAKGG